LTIKTDLEEISVIAQKKQYENDAFAQYLKHQPSAYVDNCVVTLNEKIAPQIDCTQCGNCCKTLMIQVESAEIETVSRHLHMPVDQFKEKYIEEGSSQMIVNAIPCHFLKDNKCSIYINRFSSCREFPALHIPGFTSRIFTLFMHYDRCPIIFNVVEALKEDLSFKGDIGCK
jgi:Fe-S-cluster containining protein